MGIKHLDAGGNRFGREYVIGRSPAEIRPPRQLKDTSKVPGRPSVDLAREKSNSRVLCGILPANFPRTVRRAIIGDDQLKILERLGKNGIDRQCQIPLPVIDRKPDRHFR